MQDNDFATLGFSPLRNVQVGHDLDSRNDRSFEPRRNLVDYLADTVNAVSYLKGLFALTGLKMNIGRLLRIAIYEDLVDQRHNLGIRFTDLGFFLFFLNGKAGRRTCC